MLSPDHRQHLFTEGMFAPPAYIKPLFFAIAQVAQKEVQIADSAARHVGLARHLPGVLEKFSQGKYHAFEVE